MKMMQGNTRAKVMKTDRRKKQAGNQKTKEGNIFWNIFMITVK